MLEQQRRAEEARRRAAEAARRQAAEAARRLAAARVQMPQRSAPKPEVVAPDGFAGAPQRATPPPAPVNVPKDDPGYLNALYGRTDFAQGTSNSCGTTSLAICLERLGLHIPRLEIDSHIRQVDTFSSPRDLVAFARSQGMRAETYNHGSFDTLSSQLAQGRQVMVLTDVDGDYSKLTRGSEGDTGLHYMVVTAARTENGQQLVTYQNPWGVENTVPYKQFEDMWRDLHVMGAKTGLDKTYFLIDKGNSKPLPARDLSAEATDALLQSATEVMNGAQDIAHGRPEGALRLADGLQDATIAIPANVVALSGRTASDAGRAWVAAGVQTFASDPNLLAKAGGVLTAGAGLAAQGAGWAVEGIGNVWASVTRLGGA